MNDYLDDDTENKKFTGLGPRDLAQLLIALNNIHPDKKTALYFAAGISTLEKDDEQ